MDMVCTRCEHVGEPAQHTPGSFGLELLLWLLLIVPGLLYSVWRLHSRSDRCAVCGSADLVPLQSPRGQEIAVRSRSVQMPQRQVAPWRASRGWRTVGRALGGAWARLVRFFSGVRRHPPR